MEEAIAIIGLACLSVLFVEAEPIVLIKRWLGLKEEEFDSWGPKKRYIYKMLSCALCSGFWIGLLSGSLPKAAIVAALAEIVAKKIRG